MLPAEIGRSHALTRKPDTDHAVVGKEVFRTAFQERFAARNFCFGGILYVRSLSPYGTAPPLWSAPVLIAIGTVLSLFEFSGPWALGGGITVCSMLPLVLICHRHGTKWGISSALVYGVLQMFLGMKNVMYGRNFWEVLAIILLDYVVAFGVIGLAGIFDKCIKNRPVSIAVGSVFATLLRLACHFVSGWIIWEALWPNELGWASPLWSLAYNASYMIPEMIITTVAAVALYFPLKKYYYGEDLK